MPDDGTSTPPRKRAPRKRQPAAATAPEPQSDRPRPAEPVAEAPPVPREQNVHLAIAEVMARVRAVGKWGRNQDQGYAFRSIDDFMTALNPAMAAAGVHVVPSVLERHVEVGSTRNGGRLRMVDLLVEFTIYGPQGDFVVTRHWGEGTDTSDKATNKASTGAYKYALMQCFTVPTVDLVDGDREHNEPEGPQQQRQRGGREFAEGGERTPPPAEPAVVEGLRTAALAATRLQGRERRDQLQVIFREGRAANALGVTVTVPEPWQPFAGGQVEMELGQLLQGCQRTDLPDHGESPLPAAEEPPPADQPPPDDQGEGDPRVNPDPAPAPTGPQHDHDQQQDCSPPCPVAVHREAAHAAAQERARRDRADRERTTGRRS